MRWVVMFSLGYNRIKRWLLICYCRRQLKCMLLYDREITSIFMYSSKNLFPTYFNNVFLILFCSLLLCYPFSKLFAGVLNQKNYHSPWLKGTIAVYSIIMECEIAAVTDTNSPAGTVKIFLYGQKHFMCNFVSHFNGSIQIKLDFVMTFSLCIRHY